MKSSEGNTKTEPVFSSVNVSATPAALEVAGVELSGFLDRHFSGDFGLVRGDDLSANRRALKDGSTILSVYETRDAKTVWVITDSVFGDPTLRGLTTVILPTEY